MCKFRETCFKIVRKFKSHYGLPLIATLFVVLINLWLFLKFILGKPSLRYSNGAASTFFETCINFVHVIWIIM